MCADAVKSMPADAVSIRTYHSGDEATIVQLWRESAPSEAVTASAFDRKVLMDVNFDPQGALLAEAGGQPVGFALCLARKVPMYGDDLQPDLGWITAFFVHPRWRRQGIATALLQEAVAFFQARGRKKVSFSAYAPNYFVPGIDPKRHEGALEFFKKSGFETVNKPVAMDGNLIGFAIPEDVLHVKTEREEEGYEFVSLTSSQIVPLNAFILREFSADWARSIRDALLRGTSYDNVLVATKPDGDIAGFCMYGGYEPVQERFGPFGVDANLRGLGLGKVLLYLCMDRMRGEGIHNAYFLWTGEERPSGHLYKRAGFKVTRRFEVLERTI